MISFEKSAGAVLFKKFDGEIKYLLLNYPAGHWDFPKGHTENKESLEDTVKREVLEETGLRQIKIIPGFKTQVRYFYRAKGDERKKRKKSGRSLNIFKKVIYFILEASNDEVKLSFEHRDFSWLNYEDAFDKITYKNSRNVLSLANSFLLKE